MFLFIFWLVKFVCRCHTKRKTKPNNANKLNDPSGPSHTLVGSCFVLVPNDQKISTHNNLCHVTHNFRSFRDGLSKFWSSLVPSFLLLVLPTTAVSAILPASLSEGK